ncbi:MAG TPA: phosphodiester glycosidase family protein [bacterium]|nr:phosphodiester glycosidase family protein [bacterium]
MLRGILLVILIGALTAGAGAQVSPHLPAEVSASAPARVAQAAPPQTPVTAKVAGVEDVQWFDEGKVGKVVIKLDAPANFRAFSTRDYILIDLWQAREARWQTTAVHHPYVRRIRVRQYTPQLARVYIDLKRPARYKTFVRTDPHQITVMVIPPWMATVKLPPSLAYEKFRVATGSGTTAVHVLRVDPSSPAIQIRPVLAGDVDLGKETTSVIATRYDALAGINGGFFAGSGSPLGMIVINGKLISAPLPKRTVFAISRTGQPVIAAFEFNGRVVTPDRTELWVSAVNRPPHAGGVAVYTQEYGPLTPNLGVAALVRNDVVEAFFNGRTLIPDGGYVLTANRSDAALLTGHLALGQPITLRLQISPDLEVLNALGGGPRLVKDGQQSVPFAWEWFTLRFHDTRAPRTAVGITNAGKLIFVTVDGRSARNTGMTLGELSALMVHLGAVEAMNLDGGGSATMVVGGRIVNEPSDGRERPIGSALLVLRSGP